MLKIISILNSLLISVAKL